MPAAASFYGEVLDWAIAPHPGSAYLLARAGEATVAGLLPLGEGGLAHWVGQLVTDDVHHLCRRMTFLQGQVLLPPEETPGFGTIAMIADPAGAVMHVFTPQGTALAPESAPAPGHIGFHTLVAPRADLAARVYRSLFDWKASTPVTTEHGVWTPLHAGFRRDAALLEPKALELAPQWAHHVKVEALGPVVERALARGATLLHPPVALPRVGTVAVLADPWGAAFGLLSA